MNSLQKYDKSVIEQSNYFDSKCKHKLVTGKYEYSCILCDDIIKPRDRSLVISRPFAKVGWKNCRLCLHCCQEWIEKTHQVATSKRRTFNGSNH